MRSTTLGVLLGGWLLAIAAVAQTVWAYQSTAGRNADAPDEWPAASHLARAEGLPTLVFVAHPRCPCTRASLDELNLVLNRVHGAVTANVLFLAPEGVEPGWERTDTWYRAHDLPGAIVTRDDGAETDLFHAWTSGQTLLYDASGHLVFNGGVTASRGHAGENVGSQLLLSLIETGHANGAVSSVFGCALHDPDGAP